MSLYGPLFCLSSLDNTVAIVNLAFTVSTQEMVMLANNSSFRLGSQSYLEATLFQLLPKNRLTLAIKAADLCIPNSALENSCLPRLAFVITSSSNNRTYKPG